jgi:hypothetical protein
MPTTQETVYYRARAGLLGRHFAVGTRTRINLARSVYSNSVRNDANPVGHGAPHHWNITSPARDNPLLWSSRLLAPSQPSTASGTARPSAPSPWRRRGCDARYVNVEMPRRPSTTLTINTSATLGRSVDTIFGGSNVHRNSFKRWCRERRL